jgi:hypothetical protein
MKLRKCPACKNQVDAENEVCPVCGCNPRLYRVRKAVVWVAAAAIAVSWVMLHGRGHWGLPVHH